MISSIDKEREEKKGKEREGKRKREGRERGRERKWKGKLRKKHTQQTCRRNLFSLWATSFNNLISRRY